MFFIVITFIALAWVGLGLWYAKDRFVSPRGATVGSAPYMYAQAVSSPERRSGQTLRGHEVFAAPNSEAQARIRRQQVGFALVTLAILTFAFTFLWSAMWAVHVLVDLSLIAFGVLAYRRHQNRSMR